MPKENTDKSTGRYVEGSIYHDQIDHIEIGEKQVIDGKRTQDIKIFYNFVGFIG